MGKRKREEEETENTVPNNSSGHGSTVFVSNLPYTATSTDLKTLFSDVAPVKNAFVVLEKETKVSKGVGVVVFAMREDAIQCVEKGTMDMNGRTLRVDWAGAKPRPGEDSPKKSQSPVKRPNPISPNPTKSKDPDAIRTITITGLPKDIDSKVLWKKVRKQPGAESIKYPAILADGSEDATQAFVIFASPSQATNAVEKLNAHVYKGAVIGVTLKKRLEARPNRSSRLIIRNLPWGATEADLRTLFLPYGPIYSVEIPTDANPNPTENGDDGKAKMKPKAKGFAFVWMLTKADAEKAVEGANGTTLKARVIAVDWALSKSKWQDIKDQMKEDQPPEDVSESLDDGSSSSGHSQEEEEKDGLGVHSAEDVSMHSASSDESDNEDREEPIKPELPAPEAGTKLFIRNVPWEATEDELQQLFRAFGPLRYVRIVMDKDLDRSKGTAFACYWKKVDADKVVTQSEALSKETGMEKSVKNPFSMPSLLAPDPSSSLARSLVIHGRTLDVVRAVTRETAGKLQDAGAKMREKADKRNLYLMREGVVFPNSPAASTMPAAALEKRVNSFNQRRALIRSNPSLYVSKTRLSIRQLPTFVTERGLKRLALHSIREFDKEVGAGERECLDEDELEHDVIEPLIDALTGEQVSLPHRDKDGTDNPAGGVKSQKQKQKPKAEKRSHSSKVKQAKIVRLAERVDPLSGKGRSKGYGFLETERHSDALKFLRWANNNPDVGPLLTEWWREELKESLDLLEKKGHLDEEAAARRKRIKDTLAGINEDKDVQKQNQKQAPAKRTLIIEFSIENVVVVRKREGRSTNTATDGGNQARGKPKSKVKKEEEQEVQLPPSKKRKRSDSNVSESSGKDLKARIGGRADERPTNPLGSVIGRKRRMKKAGRKG